MYISDLDYVELPFEHSDSYDSKFVQGGIDFTTFAFAYAEGDKTALTFAFTKTAAVSLGFGF